MPDHSSRQGLPDDWSRGSHAARGPLVGAETADGYGTGATAAYHTAGYGQAPADLFGEGGVFGPVAVEAETARVDAEPAAAAVAAVAHLAPGESAGARGFLGALFDFGFTSFVTPKVVRVLYVLIMIATVISALVFTIIAFKASTPFGVLTLLFGDPLFILIVLAIYRMILEFFMVAFRVAEDVRALRERGGLG